MEPLVSILIPAYNAEKWIQYTLKSALGQTWPRKEIIVVDDGSSDNTLAILRSYECKSVKVITQENMGAPAARNKALSFAQGEFIQWLDHDDLLGHDKIFNQIGNGEYDGSTRILLSGAFGTFFFRERKAKFTPNSLWKDLQPIDYFLIKFGEDSWLHTSVWLVSRKLTDIAGGWGEVKSPDDDGEYFCRVVAASERIRFFPESRSYWRIGNFKAMSQRRSDDALEALFKSNSKCIHYLRSMEDSERTRKASLKYLQLNIAKYYPDKREILEKVNELARELGGSVLPKETRKFSCVRKMVGWKAAQKIKTILWNTETLARSSWDRLLYTLSNR